MPDDKTEYLASNVGGPVTIDVSPNVAFTIPHTRAVRVSELPVGFFDNSEVQDKLATGLFRRFTA